MGTHLKPKRKLFTFSDQWLHRELAQIMQPLAFPFLTFYEQKTTSWFDTFQLAIAISSKQSCRSQENKNSTFRNFPRAIGYAVLGLCSPFSKFWGLYAGFLGYNGTSNMASIVLRSESLLHFPQILWVGVKLWTHPVTGV